jgi:F-type H+-transporting ATPase subunit b
MIALLGQALREVAAAPLAFAAEVAQFAVLVVLVWLLLRRTVGKTLAERRRRLAAELAEADAAEPLQRAAQERAAALLEEARAEAERLAARAAAEVAEARRAELERIERDAAAAILEAERAVAGEKERVARETSERLVDLVGAVVRRFLEQTLSDGERRALTQRLILDRLRELRG